MREGGVHDGDCEEDLWILRIETAVRERLKNISASATVSGGRWILV